MCKVNRRMAFRILLIDNNPEMFRATSREWKRYGAFLTNVYTVYEAISELDKTEYHFITIVEDYVRDSLIPIIAAIRQKHDHYILILTSNYDGRVKIAAVNMGADEYLPIPETLEEGIASGLAILRRSLGLNLRISAPSAITANGMTIDPEAKKVYIDGQPIPLTRSEYNCLRQLMSYPDKTHTFDSLYHYSFGIELIADDIQGAIRTLIMKIRRKIGSPYSEYIKVERGSGYRLETAGKRISTISDIVES